ncbi:Conserved_hypothetical protein [Hexamita inflata]|uniref:Uncharacterized protein n=1 Tax=Hexamita inflata TaxID=28002 RepID=A0AA86NYC3_9EUKA|nr:Conserved hypothetical protein [Hexamita inflata]
MNIEFENVELDNYLLSDDYFPESQQQDQKACFPFGVIFQPFIKPGSVQQCKKCDCGAYTSQYQIQLDQQFQCPFCSKLDSNISIPSTDTIDITQQSVFWQDPVLILTIDITNPSGFDFIQKYFSENEFAQLNQNVPNLRLGFVFFGELTHYLNVTKNGLSLISIIDLQQIPLTVPKLDSVIDLYTKAFTNAKFREQILSLPHQTRSLVQALHFTCLLLRQCDKSQNKQLGGLFSFVIAFGPDANVQIHRNMKDFDQQYPNIDAVQCMLPDERFQLQMQPVISRNYTFDFFFQTDEFIDAINFMQMCQYGGQIHLFESSSNSFFKEIKHNLFRFKNRLVNINFKVVSSQQLEIHQITGPGFKIKDNIVYSPSCQKQQIFGTVLGPVAQQLEKQQSKKKLQKIQIEQDITTNKTAYIQAQISFTTMLNETYIRVITVMIQTTSDFRQLISHFNIVPKLILIQQMAAIGATPAVVQDSKNTMRIQGGFFEVIQGTKIATRQYIQNLDCENHVPENQTEFIKGIFKLFRNDIFCTTKADLRTICVCKSLYGNLYQIQNLVCPKVFYCPIGETGYEQGSLDLRLLSYNQGESKMRSKRKHQIAIALSRNLHSILIIFDDRDKHSTVKVDVNKISHHSKQMSQRFDQQLSFSSTMSRVFPVDSLIEDTSDSSPTSVYQDFDPSIFQDQTTILSQANVVEVIDYFSRCFRIDKRDVMVVRTSIQLGVVYSILFETEYEGENTFETWVDELFYV